MARLGAGGVNHAEVTGTSRGRASTSCGDGVTSGAAGAAALIFTRAMVTASLLEAAATSIPSFWFFDGCGLTTGEDAQYQFKNQQARLMERLTR